MASFKGFFQILYTTSLIPTTTFKTRYYYRRLMYEKMEIQKDTVLSQDTLTYTPPSPTLPTLAHTPGLCCQS